MESFGRIELPPELFVGKGVQRLCYRHPELSHLCVKVTKSNPRKGKATQNPREYAYYQHLSRRNVPLDHLVACYGWIETALGEGLVYEMVADTDGNALPDLKRQIKSDMVDKGILIRELDALYAWLCRYGIALTDLRTSNLILDAGRPAGKQLIIIDGVGDRHFIKLAQYSRFFARLKINRKWRRLMFEINQLTQ